MLVTLRGEHLMIRCTFKSYFSSRTVFAGEYRKLKGNYLPHLIRKKIWSLKFSQRNLHCGL